MRPLKSLGELLASRVDQHGANECWPCRGATAGGPSAGKRYGVLKQGGRRGVIWYAHRAAWTVAFGAIPDGMQVCHRCDNTLCCNPAHLFLGSHGDNTRDREAKGRTARGLRVGGAKLPWRTVLDIRANYALCRVTQKELAERYGISFQHINSIINGKRRTTACPEELDAA
jgi:hypothetical protein